jgi:hypothetical protein
VRSGYVQIKQFHALRIYYGMTTSRVDGGKKTMRRKSGGGREDACGLVKNGITDHFIGKPE